MTETQAKAGAGDTSAAPVEDGSEPPAVDGAAADANSADGRAVVGRATVPAEKSASSSSSDSSSSDPKPADTAGSDKSGKSTATGAASVPKFTRAPGMAAPPEKLLPSQSSTDKKDAASTAGTPADSTLVGPAAAVARASVRGAATVGRGAAPVNRASGLATQPITTGERPGTPGSGPATGASRVTEAIRSARATVAAAASRGPRRARLYLKRVDPWSVMKFSFAVSFVLFIVGVVATAVLYMALDTMGVVGSVNKALSEMVGATGGDSKTSFKITARGIIVGSALLGLVNVVLFTALATLSAFIYNVCSDLVGGIELTLAEKE